MGHASVRGGRRLGQGAHRIRQQNDKPAKVQRRRVIIKDNLLARTRVECEESERKEKRRRKKGLYPSDEAGDLFILARGCQPHSKSPDRVGR